MTLAVANTIDLVSLARDSSTLKLYIVATEDLSGDGPAIELLREKFAFYLATIRSGEFDEMHPALAQYPKLIQVDHYTPLGSQAEGVLTEIAAKFGSSGIRVVSRKASYNPLRIVFDLFRGEQLQNWTS